MAYYVWVVTLQQFPEVLRDGLKCYGTGRFDMMTVCHHVLTVTVWWDDAVGEAALFVENKIEKSGDAKNTCFWVKVLYVIFIFTSDHLKGTGIAMKINAASAVSPQLCYKSPFSASMLTYILVVSFSFYLLKIFYK